MIRDSIGTIQPTCVRSKLVASLLKARGQVSPYAHAHGWIRERRSVTKTTKTSNFSVVNRYMRIQLDFLGETAAERDKQLFGLKTRSTSAVCVGDLASAFIARL